MTIEQLVDRIALSIARLKADRIEFRDFVSEYRHAVSDYKCSVGGGVDKCSAEEGVDSGSFEIYLGLAVLSGQTRRYLEEKGLLAGHVIRQARNLAKIAGIPNYCFGIPTNYVDELAGKIREAEFGVDDAIWNLEELSVKRFNQYYDEGRQAAKPRKAEPKHGAFAPDFSYVVPTCIRVGHI